MSQKVPSPPYSFPPEDSPSPLPLEFQKSSAPGKYTTPRQSYCLGDPNYLWIVVHLKD